MLFNGVLKEKFKHPLPNQDGAIKAMARGNSVDDKIREYTLEPQKIPLPTQLLKHELDRDETLQDTLLGLCDKDGCPLRLKYLCEDLEDVMELLSCEEFFDNMPMSNEFNYFVARDWVGAPVSKYELDAIDRQRRIFEKRAMKVNQERKKRLAKGKKMRQKSLEIMRERRTLTF